MGQIHVETSKSRAPRIGNAVLGSDACFSRRFSDSISVQPQKLVQVAMDD